ncbi:MAG: putative DNA modification/repair radical SAM protein [Oscillospiraceae bacterium]|nr:putative DNA modification/repair radical SAM protein [Oscillospiraceae bacterium]
MDIFGKLSVLTGAAKYDVACTSSGVDRAGAKGSLGNAVAGGICHSFSADGRCISLLKILMTNQCVYDCKYCANRISNDVPRATLDPEELAALTIAFYRRNYIEGLFLSSGVLKDPDYTMERMIRSLAILRAEHRFNGYVHAKAIPGASEALITRLGMLADRISVNIELPTERSLKLLAPDKDRESVIRPMGFIKERMAQARNELALFRNAPRFAPAGHSTQMIIGASPDSDYQIIRLAESLYDKFRLKRVFYSAYVPMGSHELLPVGQPPPLLREHRLYQSDWLLRFYGFKASEILDAEGQNLSLAVDPKCNWAINHLGSFPVEVNRADYEELLRVPGIGMISAKRIVAARRSANLTFEDLKKLGVVLKRAVYFITCSGKSMYGLALNEKSIYSNLVSGSRREALKASEAGAPYQLSYLDNDAAAIGGGAQFPELLALDDKASERAPSRFIETAHDIASDATQVSAQTQAPAQEDIQMSLTGQM